MKKAYVFALLFLVQFLFSSCASRNANIETVKSFRDLCPEKKLGICYFKLYGADKDKNASLFAGALVGGLVGALVVAGINAGQEDDAYSQELTKEFHHIYEEALGKSGFFQLSSSKNLIFAQDGKPLELNDMAKKNNLYACVNAASVLGNNAGFKKHVLVATVWEITRPSGE
ncbi:MAG: hypothetical protein IMZ64_06275, partial [Bacteroidetes bacterium]|nr:hypothetical protein [Bacteroidota bacterium]